jgi:hypothetical protein
MIVGFCCLLYDVLGTECESVSPTSPGVSGKASFETKSFQGG